MLFCAKAIVNESHNFELTHLKKKNIFADWRVTLQCFCDDFLCHALGMLFVVHTLEDEQYVERLRDFEIFCIIIILCVPIILIYRINSKITIAGSG